MNEKAWKKGEELMKKIPELKTDKKVEWRKGAGDNFRLMCELLKINAIPTKKLELSGDRKWSKNEANNWWMQLIRNEMIND